MTDFPSVQLFPPVFPAFPIQIEWEKRKTEFEGKPVIESMTEQTTTWIRIRLLFLNIIENKFENRNNK